MWLIFNTHAQMSLPCIGTGEATECAGDLSSGIDLPNLVSRALFLLLGTTSLKLSTSLPVPVHGFSHHQLAF